MYRIAARRLFLLVVFPLLGVTAGAAAPDDDSIHRSEGADGVPVFSDRAVDGSRPVQLSPANTFDAVEIPRADREPDRGSGTRTTKATYEVTIDSPGAEAPVRANGGIVEVTASVEPAPASGDRMELLMDGAVVAESRDGSFRVENVDRGEHRIRVRVVDGNGNVHGESPSQVIYVLRRSVLAP
ncbi:MAG: hypothetical protein U5R48_11020 [Gammaproteobacteria bacterium]|nr:hypothetical protein [Gammaproteobacteria bacterium]